MQAIPPTCALPTLDIEVPKSERIFGPGNNFWQMYGWNAPGLHENTAILNRMWCCEARGNWGFVVLALLGLEILIEIYGSNEHKIVACLGKWLIDRNSYKYPLSKKFYCPIAPLPKRQATKTHLSSKKRAPQVIQAVPFTSPIVGGHQQPFQMVFRTPKKSASFFLFFSKKVAFSAASPPEPSVKAEGVLGRGFFQVAFFDDFIEAKSLIHKRLPHLGGGNSNIF